MLEDSTLSVTMMLIAQMHQFKASPRKWKEKLREWNFDKNLTKNEMKVVIAKAEKRATEEGKETIFFHRGNMVPPAKFSAWQKRIIASSPASPHAKTPATIAYFTPQYQIDLGTTPLPVNIHEQPTKFPHINQQLSSMTMDYVDDPKKVTLSSTDEFSSLMMFEPPEDHKPTPGDQFLATFF
ncbi:hypothetical protein BDZ45DRAFT_88170 [Acephala macrosclerotiorum]|nr:hypothetical protein BDZ45DRAFT_88170 [Acephala macrosclerotiorum]